MQFFITFQDAHGRHGRENDPQLLNYLRQCPGIVRNYMYGIDFIDKGVSVGMLLYWIDKVTSLDFKDAIN